MKKSGIILGAAAIILLSAGCVEKESKLVCTQSASGVDITFNVDFKGNTVESMDFKYDMDLSKYSDAQIEAVGKRDFCDVVKGSMSAYKDAFNSCDQKIEDKHLVVSSGLDVDKISSSERDKMGSPEATKKALEEQGYKCTIEE